MRTIVGVALAVALGAAVLGRSTFSAFFATTANAGDSYAAGTVYIGDNDAGATMLGLSAAKPGDSDTSCLRVTSTGSLDSSVRLYATVSGSLAQYLTLTVTRGTDASPSFDSCAGFTADPTDYNGNGAGVVYRGSLAAFPSAYTAGVVDPKAATPETWSTNESHSYRFAISLDNNSAAQGLSASATFTWEARNL